MFTDDRDDDDKLNILIINATSSSSSSSFQVNGFSTTFLFMVHPSSWSSVKPVVYDLAWHGMQYLYFTYAWRLQVYIWNFRYKEEKKSSSNFFSFSSNKLCVNIILCLLGYYCLSSYLGFFSSADRQTDRHTFSFYKAKPPSFINEVTWHYTKKLIWHSIRHIGTVVCCRLYYFLCYMCACNGNGTASSSC